MARPKSTTKRARHLIQREILGYMAGDYRFGTECLLAFKTNADAYNCGSSFDWKFSDYEKAYKMAWMGELRTWREDLESFLAKIYGRRQVRIWTYDRLRETYCRLVAREYESLLCKRKVA